MNRCERVISIGRRRFLTGAGIAAAGAAATQLPVKPAKAAPAAAGVHYPSARLANVRDLKIDEPISVAYPDGNAPGILLKFGKRVQRALAPMAMSSDFPLSARTRESRSIMSVAIAR
jgi:arsenite oxidase small subunit